LSRKTKYDAQASTFADNLSHLLNNSITTGIRINSVLDDVDTGWIGYNIKPDDIVGQLIPVKLGREAASCYLQVGMTLRLDPRPEVRTLIVQGSTMGVYCHDDPESMVFHYDFHREPKNEYPAAHLQVAGSSDFLQELCDRNGITRTMDRFHFPVGGKRYRPTVEDVVEFLVTEGIARAHPRWNETVQSHLENWERIQLRAVIRRDAETAMDELRQMGYDVTPPKPLDDDTT
jgi:hypothetical protein